jgi:hypothetical protein
MNIGMTNIKRAIKSTPSQIDFSCQKIKLWMRYTSWMKQNYRCNFWIKFISSWAFMSFHGSSFHKNGSKENTKFELEYVQILFRG